jgi:hypothetical protein
MSHFVSLIESTIDGLDPHAMCRVYIKYTNNTQPVEAILFSESGMLPSHLKSLAWLLALHNPVKIVFRSQDMGSTECLLVPLPERKEVTRVSFFRKSTTS